MSLLITFLVASSALYIAKVAEEEMVGLFAAIVAILSLVLGIILAPWYIQMFILIFALLWVMD